MKGARSHIDGIFVSNSGKRNVLGREEGFSSDSRNKDSPSPHGTALEDPVLAGHHDPGVRQE